MLDFVKCFSTSIETVICFLCVLYSVDMIYYINLFSDVKPTLHSWVKFHLVMVNNSFYMLLGWFATTC